MVIVMVMCFFFPPTSGSLCQVEMAKRTATYTKLVFDLRLSLMGDAAVEPHPSQELGHTLMALPLPSDITLSEFRQLVQPHIQELVV